MHQPDTSKLPDLINGIAAVRHLHYRVITETGLTTADEMLYPDNLPLVDDLVSYHAVGARSVEDKNIVLLLQELMRQQYEKPNIW